MWTGGDVSARYERSRIAAQHQVDMDKSKITITHSNASESLTQDPRPYQDELLNSKELLSIPEKYQVPTATAGKAELQAIGSRQQVLDDKEDGGVEVLMDEAREEKEAQSMLKKTTRRRTTSSISGTESFKGLRERVTGSMHGRTGGIIGMSSSR